MSDFASSIKSIEQQLATAVADLANASTESIGESAAVGKLLSRLAQVRQAQAACEGRSLSDKDIERQETESATRIAADVAAESAAAERMSRTERSATFDRVFNDTHAELMQGVRKRAKDRFNKPHRDFQAGIREVTEGIGNLESMLALLDHAARSTPERGTTFIKRWGRPVA